MKTALFIVPVVLMVAWSIAGEMIKGQVANALLSSLLIAVGGIFVGLVMLWLMRLLANKKNLSLPLIGNRKNFLLGIGIGIIISLLAASLFYLTQTPDIEWVKEGITPRFIRNTSPAIVEEISFRGAVVHYSHAFWGKGVALAAGSVPFGLIHLVGRLLGKPVGFWHIVGVSAAGLLLSLCYLKYGLLCAIAVHWIWNSLCGFWVQVFQLPEKGGVQIFEGTWTTTLILCVFIFVIYFLPPKVSRNS